MTFLADPDLEVVLGAPVDVDISRWISRRDALYMDRFSQLAVIGAKLALEDAQLTPTSDMGVVVGNGIGGIGPTIDNYWHKWTEAGQRYHPAHIPRAIINMAAAHITMQLNLHGPSISTVSACASGADAIISAVQAMKDGEVDIMLAGGTEAALTAFGIGNFDAMHALSRKQDSVGASQPMGKDRDGFVMGEGAAMVVLERLESALERRAPIYAVISGYGRASDAYHIVKPQPDGRGAVNAMRRALGMSGLQPTEIDYINLHGTSTQLNDVSEADAIRQVFGAHTHIPCSSTKSQIGHTLGAAGAIETAATCLALRHQFIPPNLSNEIDPAIHINLVSRCQPAKVTHALKNAFAFGGHCVSIMFSRVED